MTDQQYLEGINKGSNAVIQRFYEDFKPMIYSLIGKKDSYKIISAEDFYNDVIIEVIMKIKKRDLNRENLRSKLSTYIYAVADNQLNTHFRQHKIKLAAAGDILVQEDIYTIDDVEVHPLDKLQLFLDKLKTIDTLCFQIIRDWYLGNLGYEQLAVAYGYSGYNSIKKKKGKCLDKARSMALDFSINND
jgi:RNA polymerase sigma factor (sigma-70 family)